MEKGGHRPKTAIFLHFPEVAPGTLFCKMRAGRHFREIAALGPFFGPCEATAGVLGLVWDKQGAIGAFLPQSVTREARYDAWPVFQRCAAPAAPAWPHSYMY